MQFLYDSATLGAADVTLVQALQFSVRKAGIELKLDPTDAGGYTARGGSGEYDLVTLYYVRAEPDILRTVFHSAYIPPNGSDFARVNSLDDKLARAVGAPDAERKRLYGEVQAEIIDQAYAVPISVPAYQLGASKRLHGLSWTTNAKPNFYDPWLSP